MTDLIQPTPGEKANGWTPKTLTAYINECEKAQAGLILGGTYMLNGQCHDYREPQRPTQQNNKYSPLHWR